MADARFVGRAFAAVMGAAILASPGYGKPEKTEITAENGVSLTLYADEFADHFEYDSPEVAVPGASGAIFVSRTKDKGAWGRVSVQGLIVYRGNWRFYDRGILRGGEAIESIEGSRDVVSCAGSSGTGNCLLSETISMYPTSQQIAKHSASGSIDIQIESKRGEDIVVSIPVSYFDALNSMAAK
ncbi:MAG: hypothetical protein J7496_08705 [Novosphingobium sp.]|nr:hypothetical protein [Novosphingobium sp.]